MHDIHFSSFTLSHALGCELSWGNDLALRIRVWSLVMIMDISMCGMEPRSLWL